MKFAREFKGNLESEGYPERWLLSAIPYGQLKKCLKKVQQELADLGLDPDTMKQLLAAPDSTSAEGLTARYYLDLNGSELLRPRLTVFVHLRDGVAVDATLSPTSRQFLQKMAFSKSPARIGSAIMLPTSTTYEELVDDRSSTRSRESEDPSSAVGDENGHVQKLEVPLVFDGEFFQLLQADVAGLDALQKEEQDSMHAEVVQLGQEISEVAKPSKFSKSDLSRWREIFELYLDARIFFAAQERDRGSRTSADALKQLVWFQKEVEKRELPGKFKLPASQNAYRRFLALNATILQNLKFEELNKRAITKILKKFDKRTSLGISGDFPAAIKSNGFTSEPIAKDLCSQVSTQVISQVPRLDDYLCPICFSIAWLPVRLMCGHVFCIRCTIKMQRERKRNCALCRAETVMQADTLSLDDNLVKFMEKWFRKETKEKQKANEIERGKELFGEKYQHSNCRVM